MRTVDAIVLYLVDRGIATLDVDIFVGGDTVVPRGPGPFLSLIETPGRPPVGVHNATSLRQPSTQITARGDIMTEVETLLESAYDALGGKETIANQLVGDVFFLWMRPSSEPFGLPNDAESRVRLAFNVNSFRR